MYIIVVGGGRLGYYLLKGLLNEGHEVLLLEKDARICRNITEEMGSVCYRGDGCEAATLAEVGTGRADMLLAVTGVLVLGALPRDLADGLILTLGGGFFAVFFLIFAREFRAMAKRDRRARQFAAGRCPRCGYDIHHLPEPRCPECGETWLVDETGKRA